MASDDAAGGNVPAKNVPAKMPVKRAIQSLRRIGRAFHRRAWSLGTSSNYSICLCREPLDILITASGKDKGRLGKSDFVRIGGDGQPLGSGQPAPSAETWLHIALYLEPQIGAVLHTHSVAGTILSEQCFPDGQLTVSGFEMLKGLAGVTSHEHCEQIAIFENTQHIPQLAEQIRRRRETGDRALDHAFLIRRHGLYTWGRDLDEAVRHVEVLEFLFECLRPWPLSALTTKSEP